VYSLLQKLFAEFIGTFTLIFVAIGSICADQYLRASGQPVFGLLGFAIAQGLAASVMVAAVAHISGGHLNPAVTIGFWVTKRLGSLQAISYCLAQLLGGIAAAYLLAALLPETVWRPVALGTTDLAPDFTRMHGMALEGLLTFFLVFAVFAGASEAGGTVNRISAFAVGLVYSMDVLVGGPFTGASMNPARTLGPAIVSHHWTNHGVYWVGPLFGGVVAAFLHDKVFPPDQFPI
jgi:MIP family channel proteins